MKYMGKKKYQHILLSDLIDLKTKAILGFKKRVCQELTKTIIFQMKLLLKF